MSSTRSNISPSGTIKNLLNLGFTLHDAIKEIIDNSLDARATRVRIRLFPSANKIDIDDDGEGMDLIKLTNALRINDVKPASENIGLRGLGLKAAHCVLSNEEDATLIMTKMSKSARCEIDADWPNALKEDYYDPRAIRGSEDNRPIWDAGCINPDHGTTTSIPMPPTKFAELMTSLPELLKSIGFTYEKFINAGKVIEVEVDGVAHPLDMSSALSWETTPNNRRYEVPITILQNPITKESRVYHRHESHKPVRTEMVRYNLNANANPKILRDYQSTLDGGFEEIATMKMRGAYNEAWNPPETADNARPQPGYIALCRDKRFLRPIYNDSAKAGDFGGRGVWEASRHSLEFTHAADDLIRIEVNKSSVTPENIHPLLLETMRKFAKEWSNKIYKAHFRTDTDDPGAELRNTVTRQFRQLKVVIDSRPNEFLNKFDEIYEYLRVRLGIYGEDDEDDA